MVLRGLGRPGKLLLPGPCLLGPASSSCRGLHLGRWVFSWRFPGRPLSRGAATARAQVGVLRYPYFSTPTLVFRGRHVFIILDLSVCRSLMRVGFSVLLC